MKGIKKGSDGRYYKQVNMDAYIGCKGCDLSRYRYNAKNSSILSCNEIQKKLFKEPFVCYIGTIVKDITDGV